MAKLKGLAHDRANGIFFSHLGPVVQTWVNLTSG